ncbi:hypothetical protein Purlil1_8769 [Purpureocillium lilacinum]|uniref:UFSP1/2/DUB catalytic domain-containing protein n=1 Tax=Purpureocillium lilacinum TaxID=33203 RepID=A0ABR0BRY9_PURLI|nr:hypothetical protein Purlil1_8769 [Purpureocillium lilacinum]
MTHGSGCNMEEPQLQRRAPTSPRRRPSQPAAAAKMRRAISSEASGEATSSRQTMLHALTRFLRSTRRQSQPQDTPTRDHHRSKNANRSRSGRACSKASEQDEIPHGSQLGVAHLGKFAHEREMPQWLTRALKKNGYVCARDIVPVLAQLLEHSPATSRAYLCHPCVQHISKLRREGGFCGYRNIQMLISYIVGAEAFGAELFGNRVPPVFDIQDLIEAAWDMGYNPQGRIETGGIKGTRKFIGTPEAQALFRSLQIPPFEVPKTELQQVNCFGPLKVTLKQDGLGVANRRYGERASRQSTYSIKVSLLSTQCHLITKFQHFPLNQPGHSLTVVGIEKQKDDRVHLLVFDPSCRDSAAVKRYVGRRVRKDMPGMKDLVEPYRRGAKYLIKRKEFEILCLVSDAPTAPPKAS